MVETVPSISDALGRVRKAAVTWYDNVVQISKNAVLALGLCERGEGVAFIACYSPNAPITQEWLRLLIIRDVLWQNNDCDDAKWCLNIKCPYNKVEIRHLKRYGLRNFADLKKLHEFVENCASTLQLESKGSVIISFERPPLQLKRV